MASRFGRVIPRGIGKHSKDHARKQKTGHPVDPCLPIEQIERVEDQVVYVFPTEHSKKSGRKTEGKIPFLRSPTEFFAADQDVNENENRFCA